MSQSYKKHRTFSDKFIHNSFPILGRNFTRIASEYRDRNENVDLEVQATDISFRVRKWKYHIYKNDFTIRSRLESGHITELDKTIAGFGRYLLYAISNEQGDGFHCYALIDLNIFRATFHQEVMGNAGVIPRKWFEKPNTEDESHFRVFKYSDFPDSLLIDHQGIKEEAGYAA